MTNQIKLLTFSLAYTRQKAKLEAIVFVLITMNAPCLRYRDGGGLCGGGSVHQPRVPVGAGLRRNGGTQ